MQLFVIATVSGFLWVLLSVSSFADPNRIVSCTPLPDTFEKGLARGHCALAGCKFEPKSKGSVKVTPDGKVIAEQQLETDRVDYGVCGWIEFELRDAVDQYLAYGRTDEKCIPPKPGGNARIENFQTEQQIPRDVAVRVQKVLVTARCGNRAPFITDGTKIDPLLVLRIIFGAPK